MINGKIKKLKKESERDDLHLTFWLERAAEKERIFSYSVLIIK